MCVRACACVRAWIRVGCCAAHARWLWPRKSPSVSVWNVLPLRRNKREEPVSWNRGETSSSTFRISAGLSGNIPPSHPGCLVPTAAGVIELLQTRIGNHYACGSPAISAEMSGYQGKKNIPRITVSTDQHEWWSESTRDYECEVMKWWQRLLTGAEIPIMAFQCWNDQVKPYICSVRFCAFTVVQLCQYLYIRCWITVTSHFSVTHTRPTYQTGFFVGQIHWSSAGSHWMNILAYGKLSCMHYKTASFKKNIMHYS